MHPWWYRRQFSFEQEVNFCLNRFQNTIAPRAGRQSKKNRIPTNKKNWGWTGFKETIPKYWIIVYTKSKTPIPTCSSDRGGDSQHAMLLFLKELHKFLWSPLRWQCYLTVFFIVCIPTPSSVNFVFACDFLPAIDFLLYFSVFPHQANSGIWKIGGGGVGQRMKNLHDIQNFNFNYTILQLTWTFF